MKILPDAPGPSLQLLVAPVDNAVGWIGGARPRLLSGRGPGC